MKFGKVYQLLVLMNVTNHSFYHQVWLFFARTCMNEFFKRVFLLFVCTTWLFLRVKKKRICQWMWNRLAEKTTKITELNYCYFQSGNNAFKFSLSSRFFALEVPCLALQVFFLAQNTKKENWIVLAILNDPMENQELSEIIHISKGRGLKEKELEREWATQWNNSRWFFKRMCLGVFLRSITLFTYFRIRVDHEWWW